jgi:hypothetical protein
MEAFNKQMGMRTAVVLCAVERTGKMRLNAIAVPMPACTLEEAAALWGSPLYVCEVDDLVSLMAVVMRAMYGLDHTLAEEEWRKVALK